MYYYKYLHVDDTTTHAGLVDELNEGLEVRQQVGRGQVTFVDMLHHCQARGRWWLGLADGEGVGHAMCGVEIRVLQDVGSAVKEGGTQWLLIGVAAAAAAAAARGHRWW